jgi:NAD(P)-dependent dehydrogenase (short-subunit alcohol dehydrogenase family)
LPDPTDLNGQIDLNGPIDLSREVALVTGASKGLGREFAIALARAGAAVALVARSASGLKETAAAIEAAGGRNVVLTCDVTDQVSVKATVEEAERQLGPLDIVINNAGIVGPSGPDWELDPAEWWRVIEVNLSGQFYFAHAAMPGMVARGRGRVVNVSSHAAGFASAGFSAYCASKAALALWTECLAASAAEHGVSVMAYTPGTVKTDMTRYAASRPDKGNRIVDGISELFARGLDDPIENAVSTFMQVAAGHFDGLPGRHIEIGSQPEELMSKASEIEERGLYAVRINVLDRSDSDDPADAWRGGSTPAPVSD